ncbi:MAG: VRR-NUC domain-containing protein [Acidimicrobiaceae bacterium]|nr:VRR-NUC domain-containing protein [Acidimicrobiaceae bacterium]
MSRVPDNPGYVRWTDLAREDEFMSAVIDYAHWQGWTVAHFRPAWTGQGYRTPVQADGKGFPDLLMVRGPRVVAAELKSKRGRVDEDQRAWLDKLAAAGVETHVWRPSDWDVLEKVLER